MHQDVINQNSLVTIEQMAQIIAPDERVDEEFNRIVEFIRDDRISYVVYPDGIVIPFGGFQTCMPDLYDMTLEF